jgi:hypothetical protein
MGRYSLILIGKERGRTMRPITIREGLIVLEIKGDEHNSVLKIAEREENIKKQA